ALQKKIVDQATLKNMSDAELLDLIFRPGFSTSQIITDLSGRGVGLDIVRKNIIDDLKGTIRVETGPGSGSGFFLRLTLTLAILRLLLVEVGGMTIAFPAHGVREIITAQTTDFIDIVTEKRSGSGANSSRSRD
ncbi:MAG: hybrid sensor histidine kinase/response regulator, partial [Deltaproteobacteria bacterium]|nr:hybrid sensor histidine kinase/response regulator [Deltaproteobacteria bacterium]